ncbi:MAG: hypothetical protein HYV29_13290 [Ignavibacteriales bacterium]|nr:hypothetical protein [Ignavibacteriales bacterium]
MENYTYSLLLQKLNPTDDTKKDKQFFEEFHSSVSEFVEGERSEKTKTDTDAIQRAISRLRGTLVPYLSTPLKSDKDDIERSIKDTIEDVLVQIGSTEADAVITVESFQVLESTQVHLHRQLVGVIKRLLKNGKAMLVDTGILTGKNYGSIFLSQFSFAGFSNVKAFHHGILEMKGGIKQKEFGILHDSFSEIVASHSSDIGEDANMIILHFEAQETVIEKLKSNLPGLLNQYGVKSIRLNKRSFFSGFGSPYQLEIMTDLKKHPLGTILLTIIGDDTDLEEALTEQGSLIVLEKIA